MHVPRRDERAVARDRRAIRHVIRLDGLRSAEEARRFCGVLCRAPPTVQPPLGH